MTPEQISAQRFAELRALLSALAHIQLTQAVANVTKAKGPEEGAAFAKVYAEAALGFLTSFEQAARQDEFARLGIEDPEPNRLPFQWLADLIYGKDQQDSFQWPSTLH